MLSRLAVGPTMARNVLNFNTANLIEDQEHALQVKTSNGKVRNNLRRDSKVNSEFFLFFQVLLILCNVFNVPDIFLPAVTFYEDKPG